MTININSNSIVYVLCPAGIKTGGTELSHQLVYLLNKNGIEAYITYTVSERNIRICEEFKQYVEEYMTLKDIKDNKDNLLIIPEAWTFIAKGFFEIRKAIWWMSVDNYLKNYSFMFALDRYGLKQAIKTLIKNITRYRAQVSIKGLKKINYHFVQSEYARRFLQEKNIKSEELSDYINEVYYDIDETELVKEDIVLYNPAKGANITKKIINGYKGNAQWIPLVNMTNVEMRDTLKRAKVYIDFGPFPGKDRIPREAILSYCCLITGTYGAAGNMIDLPIGQEYKFTKPSKKIDSVIEKIEFCLKEYDRVIRDFDKIRNVTLKEKKQFEKQVKDIFVKD